MSDRDDFARALGRIPSGLFICSCGTGADSHPFLASWVMQASFEPPTVSVAIEDGRDVLRVLEETRRMTLSILPDGGQALMKPFFGGDENKPFGDLALGETAAGGKYLRDAHAWLDCREIERTRIGGHHIVFAEVEDAAVLHDAEPIIHVRKNGLRY